MLKESSKPTTDTVNGEYDAMDMYVTMNRIFIKPTASAFGVYLVFNRDTEGAKVKHQNRISRHSVKTPIFGIVGTIKLLLCRYLIVVSKRSRVDTICKRCHSMSDIWRIQKVNLIPLCPGKRELTREQRNQNDEYIFMVLNTLNSGDFYYSNNYKLCSSVVRSSVGGVHSLTPDDEGFLWNSFLLKDLSKIDGAELYCVKIINGFVGVQYISCQSEEVVAVLVSRRRNKRVGTRYFCRGCDTSGEVANFVETEMIFEWFNRKCSFVILRGTAPVQWDQWPDFSFYPKPVILRAESQHLAFVRHFEWLKTKYGNQVLIDLCQYTPHGNEIHELCKDIALSAGDPQIKYFDLDVNSNVKAKRPNLPEEILKHVRDMGYTLVLNEVPIYKQRGTFRISSIDSSDYTNVVQAMLARTLTKLMLQSAMGPDIYKPPKPPQLVAMEENLNELWLKQGDALALHYTGSRALMSNWLKPVNEKSYKRRSSWRIHLRRWYMNNFQDGFRQDCLDLILGNYRVDIKSPMTRPPYLLSVITNYILPSVMTFATTQMLQILLEYFDDHKYDDEWKCFLAWVLTVLLLWIWFLSHSGNDDAKLLGAGPRTAGNTDYCGKQWQCSTFKHLMCEFKKNHKTERCSKIDIKISSDERLEILRLVNEFRNDLAGGKDGAYPDGATNIQQVTWDYELESFAEVYGSQCGSKKVPDLDACSKTKDFKEGARILWGIIENGIEDVVRGPDGWTSVIPEPDVVESFEPVDGEDRSEPNYGRFTMLAWATTYKMGCSIVKCTCSPVVKGLRKLVCFLGPSGNIRGKKVFLSGEACKSCPAGTACNLKSTWKNLCARREDPAVIHVLGRATSIDFPYITYLLVAATRRVLN